MDGLDGSFYRSSKSTRIKAYYRHTNIIREFGTESSRDSSPFKPHSYEWSILARE
jgi:hypothetical protein